MANTSTLLYNYDQDIFQWFWPLQVIQRSLNIYMPLLNGLLSIVVFLLYIYRIHTNRSLSYPFRKRLSRKANDKFVVILLIQPLYLDQKPRKLRHLVSIDGNLSNVLSKYFLEQKKWVFPTPKRTGQ